LYLLIVFVYLAIGAAIVFHMLYYRINRHVASVMCVIYLIGSVLLLISNFTLYRSVDWYQIFAGLNF
jgi:hypothetical protein